MLKKTNIIDWLRDHDLIMLTNLEREAKVPEGTILKAVRGQRGLPEKYHDKIISILKNYGF